MPNRPDESGPQRRLPAGLIAERRTPTFTAETVPPGLTKAHHTAVWAELIVTEGRVRFVEEQSRWAADIVAPGSITIVPNRKHHVEPSADSSFYVQFYVSPDGHPE